MTITKNSGLLPLLQEAVKTLVNDGVYSLYTVLNRPETPYLLVTDQRQYFLLSAEGRVLESPLDRASLQLGDTVTFPDLINPNALKSNYG